MVSVWCLIVGFISLDIDLHSRSLPDGQPDPWPVLYRLAKNVPRGVEIIAGIQQAIDLRAIFGPLLDLVKIAVVRIERVGGFLVGPIIHAQRTTCELL